MDYRKFSIFLLLTVLQAALLVKSSDDLESLKHNKQQQSPVKKATTIEKKFDLKYVKQQQTSDLKRDDNINEKKYESLQQHSSTETSTAIDPVNYEDFNEKNFSKALKEQENNPEVKRMNFSYYELNFHKNPKDAMKLWIDIKSFNDSQFVHEVLSNSHRRAASISLPFNFLFYGNSLTRITVATGGFLYLGEHVHSWLAATQYIAPLMANFETRNSSRSQILYGYNSSVFVIQWDNVILQEKPEDEFTFQCSIYPNGDIAFVYKKIPIPINKIPSNDHPVKIGVSDAYFIHRHEIFVRRKTIYEYHKIDLKNSDEEFTIQNNTAIFFKALSTCNNFKNCESCLTGNSSFICVWCEAVQRCSDGYDRLRQEWITHHCEQENINQVSKCAATTAPSQSSSNTPFHILNGTSQVTNNSDFVTPSPTVFHNSNSNSSTVINDHHPTSDNIDIHSDKNNLTNLEYNTQEQRIRNIPQKRTATAHSSLAISLFCVISLVLGVSLWIIYAYRNPISSSGQFLIRWRPSTWRWNGGETRYTAASIHM